MNIAVIPLEVLLHVEKRSPSIGMKRDNMSVTLLLEPLNETSERFWHLPFLPDPFEVHIPGVLVSNRDNVLLSVFVSCLDLAGVCVKINHVDSVSQRSVIPFT